MSLFIVDAFKILLSVSNEPVVFSLTMTKKTEVDFYLYLAKLCNILLLF